MHLRDKRRRRKLGRLSLTVVGAGLEHEPGFRVGEEERRPVEVPRADSAALPHDLFKKRKDTVRARRCGAYGWREEYALVCEKSRGGGVGPC